MAVVGVFSGSSKLQFEADEPSQSNPTASPLQSVAQLDTPWGRVSAEPQQQLRHGHRLIYMHRHGDDHDQAPHEINYRANLWCLQALGVDYVIGTHTVGSIDVALDVGDLVLPDNLIDYTWGRPSTYSDQLRHIEFSDPYDATLRRKLMDAHDAELGSRLVAGGVYGVTQGPRLETAAEIVRMARDGATLVGMTGMPEAALARELELAYCSLCLVVNPAAGLTTQAIDMHELRHASEVGAAHLANLIDAFLQRL